MNSTQKLTDEALQVYRATGLSPLEVQEHRKKLREALYAAIDELESIALAAIYAAKDAK